MAQREDDQPADPASDERETLERVARATQLREGAAGVVSVLRAAYQSPTGRLQDVARAARLPLPVASAVRRELETAGLLERRAGIAFTETGRAFVEGVLRLTPAAPIDCDLCDGSGLAPPPADALERLTKLLERAPRVDVALDQAPCTPQTALARAAAMARAGALESARAVMLGDDDSVSLALGLYARAALGRELQTTVTVLELDPERATFIREAAAAEGLKVAVVAHDLREPLPAALAGGFDVAHTDPPYTLEGARLFLTRALEALAPRGARQVFFSYAQRAPRDQGALIRLLAELELAPTAIHPGFNRYEGASVLGNVGQFMELVAVGTGERPPAQRWTGALYSAEVSPRERRYRCTECGRVTSLGQAGAPATIEALKEVGCPACGGEVFHRLSGYRPKR